MAGQRIRNILQALSALLEQDGKDRDDAGKTVEYAKLAKDLAAIFREFQDAKRLEVEQMEALPLESENSLKRYLETERKMRKKFVESKKKLTLH